MKRWQKILSTVLVIMLIIAAVWYFNQKEKACCLCNSFRYHAPCLIDLETGKLIELDLYYPHKTKVAELADPQPQTNTFSFVRLGSVTGPRLTASKIIELHIPVSEKNTNPALCKNCRKQLSGVFSGWYVLADLYDRQDKTIIPIQDGLCLELRCYKITVQAQADILHCIIQGTLQ